MTRTVFPSRRHPLLHLPPSPPSYSPSVHPTRPTPHSFQPFMPPRPRKSTKAKANTPAASQPSESPQVRAARTRAANREAAAKAAAPLSAPMPMSIFTANPGRVSLPPIATPPSPSLGNDVRSAGGQKRKTATTVDDQSRASSIRVSSTSKRPKTHASQPRSRPPRVDLEADDPSIFSGGPGHDGPPYVFPQGPAAGDLNTFVGQVSVQVQMKRRIHRLGSRSVRSST
ncbi:hypothetical protein OF83DRAFT_71046 [Amylostereum chailletii]|nr:hypothetical protein OF83DRAFT_71046 [Amylostereum chailletii]